MQSISKALGAGVGGALAGSAGVPFMPEGTRPARMPKQRPLTSYWREVHRVLTMAFSTPRARRSVLSLLVHQTSVPFVSSMMGCPTTSLTYISGIRNPLMLNSGMTEKPRAQIC